MFQVMKSIDQANGYAFGELEEERGNFSQLMSSAVGTDFEFFRLVYLHVPEHCYNVICTRRVGDWTFYAGDLARQLSF